MERGGASLTTNRVWNHESCRRVIGPAGRNRIDLGCCNEQHRARACCRRSSFYLENGQIPAAYVIWSGNVAYNSPNGFECEGARYVSSRSITCSAYNNIAYLGRQAAIVTGSGCTQPITWDVCNNILDTTHIDYIPATCSNRTIIWNYSDDCGSHGTCSSSYIGTHDMEGIPYYVNRSDSPNLKLPFFSSVINDGLSGLTIGNNDIGAY